MVHQSRACPDNSRKQKNNSNLLFPDLHQILHLKAGESIVKVVDKWHHGKNEGIITVKIIIFYAGRSECADNH
jgi:hypothetical protein